MATKKKKTKNSKPSTKTKKKVPAKKKKVATKNSVATKKKAIPNPHAGKRYFMLDFGGYGGELMVDTVPEEFVEYCDWQQGRCPMQKKAFDINNPFDRFSAFVLVPIMLIIFATVIYVELF